MSFQVDLGVRVSFLHSTQPSLLDTHPRSISSGTPCPYSSLLACLQVVASARLSTRSHAHLHRSHPSSGLALDFQLPANQTSPNRPHVKGISTELRGFLIFSRFFVMLANRGRGRDNRGWERGLQGGGRQWIRSKNGNHQRRRLCCASAAARDRAQFDACIQASDARVQTAVRCSLARAFDAHACAYVRDACARA